MDGIRLIDVGALFDQIRLQANRSSLGETRTPEIGGLEIISQIKEAPTIDAEPVRHGRWMIKHYNFTFCEYEMVPYDATRMDNPSGNLYCSECNAEALLNGHEEDVPSRYCPNCGAEMDQAED